MADGFLLPVGGFSVIMQEKSLNVPLTALRDNYHRGDIAMNNIYPDGLFTDIQNFISDYTGVHKKRITKDTSLQRDLGLHGDEAGDFMEQFSNRYNVDLNGFIFAKHFDAEGAFNPIYHFYLLLFKRQKLGKTIISVSDLLNAAVTRKWVM